jgi:hypothetical protein
MTLVIGTYNWAKSKTQGEEPYRPEHGPSYSLVHQSVVFERAQYGEATVHCRGR